MKVRLNIYLKYLNECIKKACRAYNIEVKEDELALALFKALPPTLCTAEVYICGDLVQINSFDRYIKSVNGNSEVKDRYYITCSFHNNYVAKVVRLSIHIAVASDPHDPVAIGTQSFAVPECLLPVMSEAAYKGLSSDIVGAFFGIL